MILVDTSVWIDHLRRSDETLTTLMATGEILLHPLVEGELRMGDLHPRAATLLHLSKLPVLLPARHEAVLAFIEAQGLYSTGLSFVDAHLLISAKVDRRIRLWSRDRKLRAVAQRLGVAEHA